MLVEIITITVINIGLIVLLYRERQDNAWLRGRIDKLVYELDVKTGDI